MDRSTLRRSSSNVVLALSLVTTASASAEVSTARAGNPRLKLQWTPDPPATVGAVTTFPTTGQWSGDVQQTVFFSRTKGSELSCDKIWAIWFSNRGGYTDARNGAAYVGGSSGLCYFNERDPQPTPFVVAIRNGATGAHGSTDAVLADLSTNCGFGHRTARTVVVPRSLEFTFEGTWPLIGAPHRDYPTATFDVELTCNPDQPPATTFQYSVDAVQPIAAAIDAQRRILADRGWEILAHGRQGNSCTNATFQYVAVREYDGARGASPSRLLHIPGLPSGAFAEELPGNAGLCGMDFDWRAVVDPRGEPLADACPKGAPRASSATFHRDLDVLLCADSRCATVVRSLPASLDATVACPANIPASSTTTAAGVTAIGNTLAAPPPRLSVAAESAKLAAVIPDASSAVAAPSTTFDVEYSSVGTKTAACKPITRYAVWRGGTLVAELPLPTPTCVAGSQKLTFAPYSAADLKASCAVRGFDGLTRPVTDPIVVRACQQGSACSATGGGPAVATSIPVFTRCGSIDPQAVAARVLKKSPTGQTLTVSPSTPPVAPLAR